MQLTIVIYFCLCGCGLEHNSKTDQHCIIDDSDDDGHAFHEDWFQLVPEDVIFSSYVCVEITFQHVPVPALTSCCGGEVEGGDECYLEGVPKYY